MKQEDLFGAGYTPWKFPSISPDFDGETYEPKLDKVRLTGQLGKVFRLMEDGKYRTLREIADSIGGSEAGVSARLRDLRKDKFGAHTIIGERSSVSGLWIYRMEARK